MNESACLKIRELLRTLALFIACLIVTVLSGLAIYFYARQSMAALKYYLEQLGSRLGESQGTPSRFFRR